MASSIAQGASTLLTTAGVGTAGAASGWGIYVGKLVDKPDTVICLYDSPGEAPNPKWLLDFPYVQAIVRGPKDGYGVGWTKAKDVQNVLLGIAAQTVNGDRWDGIIAVGDVSFMQYDSQDRPLFSVNFKLFVEPASSALTHRLPL